MAANSKVFSALVELSAKLNSSFGNTFTQAGQKIEKLDKVAQKTGKALGTSFDHGSRQAESSVSRLARSVAHNFHSMERSAAEAGRKMAHALHPILGPLHTLAHVTGIGAGVGAIVGGLEGAELLHGGFEVKGEREVLQNQVRTVMENRGKASLYGSVDDMVRKIADNEAPIKYEPLLEAVSGLVANDTNNKFKSAGDVHDKLMQLANISRDEQTFQLVSGAYTKSMAFGYMDRAHAREIMQDTGMPFFEYLQKATGLKGHDFEQAFRKHMITMPYVDYALRLMSEQVAKGHAEQQMHGLKGLHIRAEERIRDAKEAIGNVEEKLILPLGEAIFKRIGPGELKHMFDGIIPSVERLGQALTKAFEILSDTGRFERTGHLIGEIFGKIGRGLGLVGGGDATSKIVGFWDGLNSKLEWLDQHGEGIKKALEGIAGAIIAIKGVMLAGNLVGAFSALIGAINPLTLTIGAIAAAGALIATNWSTVRPALDPVIEGFKNFWNILQAQNGKDFEGIINNITEAGKNLGAIFKELSPLFGPIIKGLADISAKLLLDALDGLVKIIGGIVLGFNALVKGAKALIEVSHVNDYASQQGAINKELQENRAQGNALLGDGGSGYRLETFGRLANDTGYDAYHSPWGSGAVDGKGNHVLTDDDIAVSENVLASKGMFMGEKVNIIDKATGRILQAHANIGDKSYNSPGNPNVNVIESRKIKDYNSPVDIVPDNSTSRINIQSSPTIHVHGAADSASVKKAVADALSEHHDQLKRSLAQLYAKEARQRYA